MIQSDKFDSFMNIKNSIEKLKNFTYRRIIELIGFCVFILAFCTLVSLVTYSPTDPNFIYSDSKEIKNFLGIYGSIGSDFLLQGIGIISYFIPATLFILSIKIIYKKDLAFIVNSFFYLICYSVVGAIFITKFYNDTYFLMVNGSGGFVGNYLYSEIFFEIINVNDDISYYFLLLIFFASFFFKYKFQV